MKNIRQFASSGSCFAEEMVIFGKVENGITFTSKQFSGTLNSQKFWNDLREYAKSKNKYVILSY